MLKASAGQFFLQCIPAIIFWLSMGVLCAQQQLVSGVVRDTEGPLPSASVELLGASQRFFGLSDASGSFSIGPVPNGRYTLEIQASGKKLLQKQLELQGTSYGFFSLKLEEDPLQLQQVVVTATRSEVRRYDAPVMVQQISTKLLDGTQSVSLSEGLRFAPGLRVENNCSNCGFTQLRINGLDGAYSQILINSRPIFSSLASVYGLEMIPKNMIERIEVVKGGGSVLYGGNAVAGTVNIITREPVQNSSGIGWEHQLINGTASDHLLNAHASAVSKDQNRGITLYGVNRRRAALDLNEDGFSELARLRQNTWGLDAFWTPNTQTRIRMDLHHLNEFRRGGSQLNRKPHEASLAEQLEHSITGGGLSVEWTAPDQKQRVSAYTSAQFVERDSYYGSGGRIRLSGDSLTDADRRALNAYGASQGQTWVSGLQWAIDLHARWELIAGSEYLFDRVNDQMPGYERTILQRTHTFGQYTQLQFDPNDDWTLSFGGRWDHLRIENEQRLEGFEQNQEKRLNPFVPRASALYRFSENWRGRVSYAEGYRAPQVFNEDLHLELVGGAALFTWLGEGLRSERSRSVTASLNYTSSGSKNSSNAVIEYFHTDLQDPFIWSAQQELSSGIAWITKRNGGPAFVEGVNAEFQKALGQEWILQLGLTWQQARYHQEELIWQDDRPGGVLPDARTTELLRTPDFYGFWNLNWEVNDHWSHDLSGTIAGPMHVPHVIDPQTEQTVIKDSPSFAVVNWKSSYRMQIDKGWRLTAALGIKNLLDAYQSDLDRGAEKDAGYIYGPLLPQTFTFSLQIDRN